MLVSVTVEMMSDLPNRKTIPVIMFGTVADIVRGRTIWATARAEASFSMHVALCRMPGIVLNLLCTVLVTQELFRNLRLITV